jgi:hypothetical protein
MKNQDQQAAKKQNANKDKHDKARAKAEQKIRKTPIRSMANVKVPASAQIVMNSAEWYQKFAKYALYGLIASSLCAVVLSLALARVMTRPPQTLSYLMDGEGRIVKLQQLSEHALTQAEVVNWAAKKFRELNFLTFTDYLDHIESLRPDFEIRAFESWRNALYASQSLRKVQEQRAVQWVEPTMAPRILHQGVEGGQYFWMLYVEGKLYMAGGDHKTKGTTVGAVIRLQRASRARNLAGIVIAQFIMDSPTLVKQQFPQYFGKAEAKR